VVNNYLLGREPFPFDLLYWNADATRMPCANQSFYLRHFYLRNELSQGRLKIAGKRLDLNKVTIPVYNLASREDHIAPARSVFLGSSLFGGPVRFVLAGSGHIAGVINPPARNKYQHWTDGDPKGELEDWLARAEEHPGSWWPDWQAWIETLDDGRVKARKPGGGRLKPLEDAPGSFVRMKA
jgi:polyhydroxyalkanoate synthase subunit PhaC